MFVRGAFGDLLVADISLFVSDITSFGSRGLTCLILTVFRAAVEKIRHWSQK